MDIADAKTEKMDIFDWLKCLGRNCPKLKWPIILLLLSIIAAIFIFVLLAAITIKTYAQIQKLIPKKFIKEADMGQEAICKRLIEILDGTFIKKNSILGWLIGLLLSIFAVMLLLIGLITLCIYELAKPLIAVAEKTVLYFLDEFENILRKNAAINGQPTELGIPKHQPLFRKARR